MIGLISGGVGLLVLLVVVVVIVSQGDDTADKPRDVAKNNRQNNNQHTTPPSPRINDRKAASNAKLPPPTRAQPRMVETLRFPESDFWNVQPDPAAQPFALSDLEAIKPILVPRNSSLPVLPSIPSPYFLAIPPLRALTANEDGTYTPHPVLDFRSLTVVGGIPVLPRQRVIDKSHFRKHEALSRDGRFYAFGAYRTVTLWNTKTGDQKQFDLIFNRGTVADLRFTGADQLVAVQIKLPRQAFELIIWDCESGGETFNKRFLSAERNDPFVNGSLFPSSGGRYVVGMMGQYVWVFDVRSSEMVGRITMPRLADDVIALNWYGWHFSPDGKRLAGSFRSPKTKIVRLVVFDFETGACLLDREYWDERFDDARLPGGQWPGGKLPGIQWVENPGVIVLRSYLVVDAQSGDLVWTFPDDVETRRSSAAFPRLVLDSNRALVRTTTGDGEYFYTETALEGLKENIDKLRAGRKP